MAVGRYQCVGDVLQRLESTAREPVFFLLLTPVAAVNESTDEWKPDSVIRLASHSNQTWPM